MIKKSLPLRIKSSFYNPFLIRLRSLHGLSISSDYRRLDNKAEKKSQLLKFKGEALRITRGSLFLPLGSSFSNEIKMKRSFFQAAVTSILLYGSTTWTLTKRLEKKLDGNYTRMLRAMLNKSWWQHPTRHQLYGHLPPITKTIQVRRTRHAGHCWRSRDELISDVLLWTPTHGRAKAGRPARTYIQQLCEDTGCCPEDLPEAMNDREKWRERVRDFRATSTAWWWWWWYFR